MRTKNWLSPERVTVDDKFWSPRLRVNDTVTLERIYRHLVESGRIENLRRAANGLAGNADLDCKQRMYRDESDVYKWIEAASYTLNRRSDPAIKSKLDRLISLIESAQEEDGYLNSYFSLYTLADRWTHFTTMHELYVAGHLFEAAVAHHHATGETRLLDVATDFADHIYEKLYDRAAAPGHQEIELALVRLFQETDDDRYLALARRFLDVRGTDRSPFEREMSKKDPIPCTEAIYEEYRELLFDETGTYDGAHIQDHRPVREQTTAVGHAVRAAYLYCGMADVAMEAADDDLAMAVRRIWNNTVQRRMYLTGGLGDCHENEGFTDNYALPTDTAYAETCASVGNVMWNHRMVQLTGEGKYGDLMERALYNGVLPGVSLDGTRFFYTNPLESNGERHPLAHVSETRFTLSRREWYDTPCCPPNVARLLGSLEKYIYLIDKNELSIELYIGGSARVRFNNSSIRVQQKTAYPWDGTIKIRVITSDPTEFTLRPRIPGWCSDPEITINGSSVSPEITDGHVELRRTWQDEDTVELTLPMGVTQIEAHPQVTAIAGQVALQRGPVVYCFEGVDNDIQLSGVCLPSDTDYTVDHGQGPNGIPVIRIRGMPLATASRDSLYEPRTSTDSEPIRMTAVPYFSWANRERSEMRVWMKKCGCEPDTE